MRALSAGVAALALASCGASLQQEPGPDSVVTGVNYVGIAVSDVDRAAAFYQASADFTEVARGRVEASQALDALAGRSGVGVETRMLRTVNAQIRLMAFDTRSNAAEIGAVPVEGPGIAHICHQVARTTQTYQRFQENGARTIGNPELVQLNPRNPVYYGYLYDLDDAVIEVEHVDIEALNLETPPPNAYRMRHVALATPDIDRLVAFYSGLFDDPNPRFLGRLGGFGGEKIDAVSGLAGSKLKMAWFQVRNLELEIAQYVSHPTVLPDEPRPLDAPGYNMIVLDVTDLDAAAARLVELGGTLVTEPEMMDGGAIVFGRDPDGNILGLQVSSAEAVVSSQNFTGNGT